MFIHCAHEPSALHDPDARAGQSLVSDIADTSPRRGSGRVVGGWVEGYGEYIYTHFAHTLECRLCPVLLVYLAGACLVCPSLPATLKTVEGCRLRARVGPSFHPPQHDGVLSAFNSVPSFPPQRQT